MDIKKIETAISHIDEKYILEAGEYILDGEVKSRNKVGINFNRRQQKMGKAFSKLAACFWGVVILSISVIGFAAASGKIPAYDILYSLYPEIAAKLAPVNLSCIDNGIQMEVETLDIEHDTANIYISMKDLEEDRIDETMDLFDSYYIYPSDDSIGTCSKIDFDEKEKEVTFLIQLQQMYGKKIERKKLTFGVTEFLSGKQKMEEELPQINLENVEIVTEVQKDVEERGASGMGDWEEVTGFLKENKNMSFSPIDGVRVTAYGFVDGRLHIQVYYDNILETDNHGYIYLKDKEGNVISSDVVIGFWDEKHEGSYDEYVFNITPEDDLTEYTPWGYFRTCSTLTKGDWKVTFWVEEKTEVQ